MQAEEGAQQAVNGNKKILIIEPDGIAAREMSALLIGED